MLRGVFDMPSSDYRMLVFLVWSISVHIVLRIFWKQANSAIQEGKGNHRAWFQKKYKETKRMAKIGNYYDWLVVDYP